MTKNMDGIDRVSRLILGGLILAGGLASGHWEMCIPTAIAVISGLVGFCPFYTIFGFDTLDETPAAEASSHTEAA